MKCNESDSLNDLQYYHAVYKPIVRCNGRAQEELYEWLMNGQFTDVINGKLQC